MSQQSTADDYITREVPLDRLERPPADIRADRPEDDVNRLAGDMDRNGQLQAAYCAFGTPEDMDPEELDELSLEEVYEDTDAPVVVIDGNTRWEAADILGWPTLRAEIHADVPNYVRALSLSANQQRIPLSDYEEIVALDELREDANLTLEELGDRVGYHKSTLSQYLSALDEAPEIVAAWKDRDSPVELGHVRALRQVDAQLSSLADSDSIPLEARKAKDLSERYKQLYLNDVLEHERSVSYLRQMIDEDLKRRVLQELDDRDHETQIADGQTSQTEQDTGGEPPQTLVEQPGGQPGTAAADDGLQGEEIDQAMCIIHGGEADRKVAVTVCGECAGVLQAAIDQRMPLIRALDENVD